MRFHHNSISPGLDDRRGKIHRHARKILGFSSHRSAVKIRLLSVAALIAVASVGVIFTNDTQHAYARDYDAEIKNIENQIKDYNKQTSKLVAQSDTLSNRIASLKSEEAALQAQINLSNAQKAKLERQITEAQNKIDKEVKALSENLKEQYYSSQTSALDILMNSNSVSEYVDTQTRQKTINNEISKSVDTIQRNKKDLEKEKAEVERVIKRQKQQKAEKQANEAEQQKLLNDTKGKEETYKKLTKEAQAKKARIQREQQEAIAEWIASHSGSNYSYTEAVSQCGGGYPFCNAAPDTYQSYGGFTAMGNARECVSYVQWRIYQLTGRNERHGNARDWLSVANSSAKANVAAIMNIGYYGHIVWVERVGTGNHAGQLYISEYNWSPYQYSERWVSIGAFAGFYDPR